MAVRAAREALKRKRRKNEEGREAESAFLEFRNRRRRRMDSTQRSLLDAISTTREFLLLPPSVRHYVKIPTDRESSKIDARAILPAMPAYLHARTHDADKERECERGAREQTVQLFCEKFKMQQKRNTPRSCYYFQQVTS